MQFFSEEQTTKLPQPRIWEKIENGMKSIPFLFKNSSKIKLTGNFQILKDPFMISKHSLLPKTWSFPKQNGKKICAVEKLIHI